MDWSWLLLLACPLMMILMMFGMRGGHGYHDKGKQEDAEKIQRELSELRAQNEQMRRDIQNLSR
ncbi:DUF2933 domain-containing protein [Brevibacillus daliensis]|uniref:DUF2933 domain-containing protein n=1 Tax=Brevibacillus daliensis TaxID=2892995 RepID=UPI001E32EAD1|nr:DUF2933 domain-containing protein [Brevibacillus daliensis]